VLACQQRFECGENVFHPNPAHLSISANVPMACQSKSPLIAIRRSEQPHSWYPKQVGSMQHAGVDPDEEVRFTNKGQRERQVQTVTRHDMIGVAPGIQASIVLIDNQHHKLRVTINEHVNKAHETRLWPFLRRLRFSMNDQHRH